MKRNNINSYFTIQSKMLTDNSFLRPLIIQHFPKYKNKKAMYLLFEAMAKLALAGGIYDYVEIDLNHNILETPKYKNAGVGKVAFRSAFKALANSGLIEVRNWFFNKENPKKSYKTKIQPKHGLYVELQALLDQRPVNLVLPVISTETLEIKGFKSEDKEPAMVLDLENFNQRTVKSLQKSTKLINSNNFNHKIELRKEDLKENFSLVWKDFFP